MNTEALDKWLLTILLLCIWGMSLIADFMGINLSLNTNTIADMLLGAFIAEVKNHTKMVAKDSNGKVP